MMMKRLQDTVIDVPAGLRHLHEFNLENVPAALRFSGSKDSSSMLGGALSALLPLIYITEEYQVEKFFFPQFHWNSDFNFCEQTKSPSAIKRH